MSIAKQRGRRIFRGQRDRLRGYAIDGKFLGLAIGVEAVIIAASLYAGWLFAVKYTDIEPLPTQVAALGWAPLLVGRGLDFWMAVVGAAMLAACELARIPLAMAFRAHRSIAMRILAVVGVAAMVVVTTKTVATVLGQAYHVRRLAVIEADATVKLAEADLARIAATRGSADEALKPLQTRVDQANNRIAELNELIRQQGEAPKQRCWKENRRNSKGRRYQVTKCSTPPWAGQQLVDRLDEATAERDAALAARNMAAGKVGNEVERVAAQEKAVAEARARQRDAVMNSQLHDFAGVVLGKDALDISEQELNWFLRVFVLVPALLIAAASTLLAMVSFTRIPRPKQPKTTTIYVQVPEALRDAIGNDNAQSKVA